MTDPTSQPQYTGWFELLRYPTQLAWYAAGVVACASRDAAAVRSLLLARHIGTDRDERQSAAHALNYGLVVPQSTAKELPGYRKPERLAATMLDALAIAKTIVFA